MRIHKNVNTLIDFFCLGSLLLSADNCPLNENIVKEDSWSKAVRNVNEAG